MTTATGRQHADSAVASPKPERPMRTFSARLSLHQQGPARKGSELLTEAMTAVSVAIQATMLQLKAAMHLERDSQGHIVFLDLIFPCQLRDIDRAEKNVAKELRQLQPKLTGPRGEAQPLYRNSYRLEEVLINEAGVSTIRFRIAQAFGYWSRRGKEQLWQRTLDMIPATILQQVINSWLRPDFRNVPTALRAGVAQHAAQQFLSHIGLHEEGSQKPIYPNEERDPNIRLQLWREALERIERSATPFAVVTARELDPRKYAAGDARGDRLVTVDGDWQAFATSPFSHQLPLNFVAAGHVVVYRRTGQGSDRLYAALPILDGIGPDSRLWQLAQAPELAWWHRHVAEFTPLPAWAGATLTSGKKRRPRNLMVVPLAFARSRYGRELFDRKSYDRFVSALSGTDAREVCWSLLLVNQGHYYLHFVTAREVVPVLRPNVLGIHFGTDPIVWWSVVDSSGASLTEGKIEGNEILSAGLSAKLRLEVAQGQGRWVGERRFTKQLKQRTYEVARAILKVAEAHNANVAFESISWVDKRSGGPEANRRFSMWNFSDLPKLLQWYALDRLAVPIKTVAKVSDYTLRFTCPACGACRAAKQKPEHATTRREGEILSCRKCGYDGPVADDHQAELVARIGAARLTRK